MECPLQYALVNNEKVEATPDLNGQGLCPGCLQPVTAVCGDQRLWHWRHRTKKKCDQWWASEKQRHPRKWREFIQHDSNTGEKHIADVRTPHGLVIEFQHSKLNSQERIAREHFYGSMVWVVDGTKAVNGYRRFVQGTHHHQCIGQSEVLIAPHPEKCLNPSWLESAVPVLFDFRGAAPIDSCDAKHESLWSLLPGRAEGSAVLVAVSPQQFVEKASSSHTLFNTSQILSIVGEQIRQQREMHMLNVRRYLQKYRHLPHWM